MNRFYTILTVSFALVALCGCDNDAKFENIPNEDDEIEVSIPSEGYIFFNAKTPSTRGKEVQEGPLINADFGVLGYRYPSSWSAVGPQARQNKRIAYTNNENKFISATETSDNYMGVFFGEDEKSWEDSTPTSQVVKYLNGAHSYSPLQSWQKNLIYSFFAWYPVDENVKVNGGNINNEGNPFITYSLPTGGDRKPQEQMLDILTGCRIDYTKKQNGMSVNFDMKHRLAAFNIYANSLINAKSLRETYGSKPEAQDYVAAWAEISDDAIVKLNVTDLSLTLNKIKSSVKIPLDTEDNSQKMTTSGSISPTYTGFQLANGIEYSQTDLTSLVGEDEMMFFIPQDETIDAFVKVSYEITCNGITKVFKDVSYSQAINIEGFEENVYHYMVITFTKSGLFVKAYASSNWDILDEEVEHEFQ